MNRTAFLFATLSGLSTILGYLLIYVRGQKEKIIASSLGLAIGVMLFVSLFDLLPGALSYFKLSFYSIFSYIFWILFFIIGVLISLTCNDLIKNNDNLYRIGLISLIILVIHNIPEGIITYLTTDLELKSGLLMMISISLHNIPEGITIAMPIYYSTNSKIKPFICVLVASLAEPLGALIAHIFISDNLSNMFCAIMYSTVAGLMISVALQELLPEAKLYSKKYSYLFIIVGFIIIFISHLLL